MNRRKFISVVGSAVAALSAGIRISRPAAASAPIPANELFRRRTEEIRQVAKSLGATAEELDNDLGRISARMGREAARKINEQFWAAFIKFDG